MIKIVNTIRLTDFFTTVLLLYAFSVPAIAQSTESEQGKIRTVVIDAGHGGRDSGALGKISKEKDIVLAIALKAGKYIENNLSDVKVIYTRTTDEFIALDERANIANENHADLFISIHANSNPSINAIGTETFAMGLHKTEGNFEVAKKENSVITFEENYETKYEGFDPNDVESYIMFSLIQDIYLDYSLTAASLVQDQFRERAKRRDRGVKQAGFLVLWKTSTPSILVETGFISNPSEEKYLISEQGQEYIASAIYRAFKEYKNTIESNMMDMTIIDADTLPALDSIVIPEIITSSSSSNNGTTINGTIDGSLGEVIFKVQIAASSKQLSPDDDLFKEFNDIDIYETASAFKYAVGSKNSYSEVVEYSKWVKTRYPDAFIIAVRNGEIIPLGDALKLSADPTN